MVATWRNLVKGKLSYELAQSTLHNQLARILEYGTTEHEGIHFNMKRF